MDIAHFSDSDYEHAAALEGEIWNTAPRLGRREENPRTPTPQNRALEQPHHHPHDRADHSGDPLHAARLRILHGFSSIAISDTTIESWMSIKPEHLKILGVDTNINAVVIKVSMIVAVFSGLSFVATTSSDEKYARSFLKPMIERIKHILIIRDIYLGLLAMPKNEVLIPLEEEKSAEKETDKA